MTLKLRRFLLQKQIFLFDLDGTLYMGKKLIPGAIQLIKNLRRQRKQIFFFTNNSSRSVKDYVKKLRHFGFAATENEIVMSTHTLISFLKRKSLRKIFLLGTPSMVSMLSKEKIYHSEENPQAVVVGFDKTLSYEKLLIACRLISKGCPFIVTHPDLFCPTDEGPEPDCGAIAKLLELSSGASPQIVLGKPHLSMISEAMKRAGGKTVKKKEIVLIGDRLSTDIAMGVAAGIDTVLVLSGETKRRDLRALRSRSKPTHVVPSVKSLGVIG
jgi:HAD superfamily hydrolase (TIGR01457 family)